MIAIGLVMITDLLTILRISELSGLIDDFVGGQIGLERLEQADRQLTEVGFLSLAATAVAGVPFVAWLWRARRNTEFFTNAEHRRSIGWLIGGWVCPVVNLWFPCQIASDVQAASDPRTEPIRDVLVRTRGGNVVILWWLALLGGTFIGRVATSQASNATSAESLRPALTLAIVSCVLNVLAGVLAIRMIRTINRLQLNRPVIPWWAAMPPAPPTPPVWPWQSQEPSWAQLPPRSGEPGTADSQSI
jgi:hypothetical protein